MPGGRGIYFKVLCIEYVRFRFSVLNQLVSIDGMGVENRAGENAQSAAKTGILLRFRLSKMESKTIRPYSYLTKSWMYSR
jgi:hypothetical protein